IRRCAPDSPGRRDYRCQLGSNGRAVRAGLGRLGGRGRAAGPENTLTMGPGCRPGLGTQDAPMPDRSRGQPDCRLRRRDRRRAGPRGFLRPGRPDRAVDHARHPQSAQPDPARGGRPGHRAYPPVDSADCERVAMSDVVEIRAPAEQTEGTRSQILRWLKSVGQEVIADEPLIEIETDKVTVEVAAPGSGTLREILKQEQEEIAPGELLGRIDAVGAGKAASARSPETNPVDSPV